jgi:hypothetical protein
LKISTLLSSATFLGVIAISAACNMGTVATPTTIDPDKPTMGAGTLVTTDVTFHKDIQPILQDHCQGCHVAGGIAPMPLLTYQDAQTFASLMQTKTAAKEMPPWGARTTDECKPRFGFQNDPTLSDAQIKMIGDWASGGTPEGNLADAPPQKNAAPVGLANPTHQLTPKAPYSIAASGDQFRCFVLDPKLAQDMYVNGFDIKPGNTTIVHHVLVFSAPDGAASIKQPLDASGSYDCFGGPGFDNTKLVAAWAPGSVPSDLPSNIGMPLAKGTALVMQIHYHPHSNASFAPDLTTFQMRMTTASPEYNFDLELIGNFPDAVVNGTGLLPDPDDRNGKVEFRIPAGSSSHTETMEFTLTPDIVGPATPQIYGVGAHMHLVGTDQQISVTRAAPQNGDPVNECLLAVPEWSFNWQRLYSYNTEIAKLPYFLAGDKLTVRCKYDNTMQNPSVAASMLDQGLKSPADVVLGETTLDEMCLGVVAFVYKL